MSRSAPSSQRGASARAVDGAMRALGERHGPALEPTLARSLLTSIGGGASAASHAAKARETRWARTRRARKQACDARRGDVMRGSRVGCRCGAARAHGAD
eukprot:2116718-Pleurochrysis_carterae.AAC.2